FPHLIAVEGVREAEHRGAVGYLREGVGGRPSDPLGGGVRRDQLRVLRFQLLQLAEERVVLGVGDLRLVEHVILPVCAVDARAQFQDASLRFLKAPTLPSPRGGGNLANARAHTLTIGARLTARIFMPTRSNLTMISSSVRVIVLFSTLPRPQERCSTWSPGWYRCTNSTGADGRAASTTRAGAIPA